jgi:hypothetical protein
LDSVNLYRHKTLAWAAGGGTAVVLLLLGAIYAGSLVVVVLAVLAGLLLFSGMVLVPRWVLPSAALVLFATLPTAYLAVPAIAGRYVSPAVIVMAVWAIRGLPTARLTRTQMVGFVFALTGMATSALLSAYSTYALAWSATFVFAFLLPLLLTCDEKTARALRKTWQVVVIGLACLGLIESIAKQNVFSRFYTFDQHWSVYRVETLLGHPLMNGFFFAVSGSLFFGYFVRQRTRFVGIAFASAVLGTVLSGSRSGLAALLAGIGVVAIVMVLSSRSRLGVKLFAVTTVVAAVVLGPRIPILAARAGSEEALGSSAARDLIYQMTWNLIAKNPVVGSGVGSSPYVGVSNGIQLPIESAVLGSIVSVGLVGAIALAFVMATAMAIAVRRRQVEVVAAVTAFVLVGLAFPLWEPIPATWVVMGLLVILANDNSSSTYLDDIAKDSLHELSRGEGNRFDRPHSKVVLSKERV